MANKLDINKIRETFECIRDERVKHANTARRIGNAFLSLLDYAANADNDKLSAIDDDTAHGLITFLKGIKIGALFSFSKSGDIIAHSITSNGFSEAEQKGFTIAQKTDDGGYKLCLDEFLAWQLATIANLHITGDSQFDGTLVSPDFVSGFLGGKGWRLANNPVTNAAGVQENKYGLELDNLIVRGTMRIFEMIISQLLGENDNRIFTAMLEVDHYDAASGKVYLDTHEGRMYNPFRKDDCVMVQQYGGISESGNDHTVTKQYELIVTEAGSEGTGEKMLAWVKFKNFTSSMEGATPDKLIAKRDTFVRVDNLTDPDRKGIIQMMTVGSDTPYMDIIYGMKTDPDNALKGRLGNLRGITHPLFGALSGFGEFLQNLYATGDFIIRRTGESIDTKIQMLQSQFATRFAQTSYEATEESNYLHNGQFLTATGSEDDCPIIDGWSIDDTDEAAFWVDANGLPVMVNGQATISGNRRVSIENDEGRNVLHILNSGMTQANAVIRKPGTHKEYTQPSAEEGEDGMKTTSDDCTDVQDTLYISARIYAKTAGTLTMGFDGCEAVEGKANDLSVRAIDVPYSAEWQIVKLEGKWNGTGDFVLRYTGDIYVTLLTITDEPLDNLSKTVSTQIKQTASNIKLLAQNIDKVNGTATQLGIDLDAQDESIRSYVDKTKEGLDGRIEQAKSEIKQTTDAIVATVETNKKDADETKANLAKLEVTVDGINTAVGEAATKDELSEAQRTLETALSDNIDNLEQNISDAEKNACDHADEKVLDLSDNISPTITLVQQKSDSWSVAAGAFDEKGNLKALTTIKADIEGIKQSVGEAATTENLMEAETRLSDTINQNYQDVTQGIADAKDDAYGYADSISTGIHDAYDATISLVQQKSDSWSVAAGAFDKDGHLVECSGMNVSAYFTDLFAKKINIDSEGNVTNISKSGLLVTSDRTDLETKISDAEGKIVSKASIETMIKDGVSNATIQADQINFSGKTTTFNTGEIVINSDNFKLDKDGNVEINGKIHAKSIFLDLADGDDVLSGSMLIGHRDFVLPEIREGECINIKLWVPLITRNGLYTTLTPANSNVEIWTSDDPTKDFKSELKQPATGIYDLIGFRQKGSNTTRWMANR